MPETIWKKLGERDISLLDKIKTNDTWLDFSKWFTYKNPDLDNVHNSPSETKELNRKKAEKYLWEEIKDKKLTEEEIKTRTDSMTIQQAKWFNEKAKTDEYDLNTLYSYIDHRDERKNPNAEWILMYEKKGSTIWDSINRWPMSRIGGTLIWWEWLWRITEWIWNYQFNKTMDKYLPEDVSRLVRYTKYENVPELLSKSLVETEEQITKTEQRLWKSFESRLINWWVSDDIRQNLEELYARRDAIKESLNAVESTKKNLPKEKPETARETAKRMKLRWSDLNAAWQAATESSVYYTTEIAPIYKQVKAKFNMWDIFDWLTKNDFQWITEWEWEDMKKIISKEKEAYSKYSDISVEELHKTLDDFDLSKSRLKWEEAKWLNAQLKDVVHTKINNMIDEAVERELPWRWFKNKKLVYNNMRNIEDELKDYAVSWWKRKSQSALKNLRDSTTRSIKIKRWLWTNLRIAWQYRPSTFIKKVIDRFKKEPQKIVEKWKEIVDKWIESPTVKKVVENKKLVNPKSATQPKLFWSPMDFATVALWDMLEMWWLESPLEILTEIASYALETNKLNNQNWTNLPLYDIEKSYINQNTYNWLTPEERVKKYKEIHWYDLPWHWDYPSLWIYNDESIYEQDWYKKLLEEEKTREENYKNTIEDIDIEELLNSIK